VLETPQFFMMAPNWVHMPLNKTHHQLLGGDQTLLIFLIFLSLLIDVKSYESTKLSFTLPHSAPKANQ
jgi:hypothetical protein